LHLLGLDHERPSFSHHAIEGRLTDGLGRGVNAVLGA
jgi:hypothetical protein